MAYPQHALLNLSAASPKKTRTRAVRLIGSVGVPAYEVQCAWLAKTVDCVVNGKAQETPSQGWKTFLRNHEGIASIGLFVVRLRRHSRLQRDARSRSRSQPPEPCRRQTIFPQI